MSWLAALIKTPKVVIIITSALIYDLYPGDASTHLALDTMAAILVGDNSKCIFLNGNDRIPMRISLKFVPRSSIDNKPALVQVMAWRRIGDKSLPKTMLTQSLGLNELMWYNYVAVLGLMHIFAPYFTYACRLYFSVATPNHLMCMLWR